MLENTVFDAILVNDYVLSSDCAIHAMAVINGKVDLLAQTACPTYQQIQKRSTFYCTKLIYKAILHGIAYQSKHILIYIQHGLASLPF